MSDEELLSAYRSDRNNAWLGHLLQRYTSLLLGVAYKYLQDKAAAEDAVQHVFETTLTHLPDEKVLNFKGWLYVLMRNHCLQQLRNKKHFADESVLSAVAAQEDGKAEAEWLNHTLDEMNDALEQLNDAQRETITLFYMKKHSYEQITEQTGFTFMQVKSYIQNGKRNLKAILIKKLGIKDK